MPYTTNRQAWRAYLRGEKLFSVISRTDMANSRRAFEEATRLDPDFARAWGYLSYTYTRSVLQGWMHERNLARAESLAKRAVALDPDDYAPYWDLAFAYLNRRKFKDAEKTYKKALRLYENSTDLLDRKHGLLAEMGEAYVYMGKMKQAIALLERAQRFPDWYRWDLSWAYFHSERYEDAIAELEKMRLKPGCPGYVVDVLLFYAAAYAQKGNLTMARTYWDLFKRMHGKRYTIQDAKKRGCFPNTNKKAEKRWLDGLRKAGVPLR